MAKAPKSFLLKINVYRNEINNLSKFKLLRVKYLVNIRDNIIGLVSLF